MSEEKFISADTLAKKQGAAKVYLMKRAIDYQKFIEGLDFVERHGDPILKLDNGKRLYFRPDSSAVLYVDSSTEGRVFQTWEQFAAYYLAKHW